MKVTNALFQSAIKHAKLAQLWQHFFLRCSTMCCTLDKKVVVIEEILRKLGNIKNRHRNFYLGQVGIIRHNHTQSLSWTRFFDYLTLCLENHILLSYIDTFTYRKNVKDDVTDPPSAWHNIIMCALFIFKPISPGATEVNPPPPSGEGLRY